MLRLIINDLSRLNLVKLFIELILEFFPEILDVEFTAKMEQELDNVEEGKIEWVEVIDEFYQGF